MVDVKFEIIGHTDNKGSDDYNQKLSEDRARSVKHYLIDNYKVKPISLLDSGKGESELLANIDGSNPKNRRVEISSILD
jgi:outer membrane protein OmpA-like peptidoglycan-associated protein